MPRFTLESADADFFTTAPHIFAYQKRFAAPPERVWESLVSDESLAAWGPSVKAVNWLSPRPFGVGTSREVTLAPGVVRVHETFFRWEEGHRYSFSVDHASIPSLRRFAEDYLVEPVGDGQTQFTWIVAIEPKPAFAWAFKGLAPVVKAAFGRLASDGQRYFAKQV
ncbi:MULTISPECIES: SRPBCC family protein [unclassified Mycolicibacterium]|uniref:SRPBCC family protein n=1 Tax=unclassified Mycolicibacterium TaxID=2636767 RepID=UPI0012DDFAAD|nr:MULTISPECIES: SRPBCC family protein [unclassified Mycolicibacterium]MUL84198.1 SRPBCC family protein [Mycolicibacterium sp. CBMA 329]MUL89736.1 SRPBCC family protein [Mycolicibacterium sp. CBMA 331]MUL99911.1 SRPBCC family protein [Mycolicibacterium sp. CBMA 334]MUM27065.1 SRPBCC family protein [Mycolicibacterium sp. CBMA 295]MUM39251.1 SRPBCC family protein [Mycolicibacterium sp. CBMA 247]